MWLITKIQRLWRKLLRQQLYWVQCDRYSRKHNRFLDRTIVAIWARNELSAIHRAEKHLSNKSVIVLPCIAKFLV